VEQWVAAGQHDHALAAQIGLQSADDLLQVGANAEALGRKLRHQPQRRLRTEHQVGGQQQLAGPRRQTGQPIAADADDVDLGFDWTHGGSSWSMIVSARGPQGNLLLTSEERYTPTRSNNQSGREVPCLLCCAACYC